MNEEDVYRKRLQDLWITLSSEQKTLFNLFRDSDMALRMKTNQQLQAKQLLENQKEKELLEQIVIQRVKDDIKKQELANRNILPLTKAWKRNLESFKKAGL
jgi:hypothetical protein